MPRARSSTVSCSCTGPAAAARIGCGPRSATSVSVPVTQPLDESKYFMIRRDGVGRGGSWKPSDGLRAKFPHYRYHDIVTAEHQLVTEHLNVRHLRLVLGSSMGGMHSWMWGYMYPELMDGVVPIASQPIQVSG